jgi:hypothetical protein
MPYADRTKRLEAMRAYAQTQAGKAAKQRSHRNYIEKRRAQKPLFAVARQEFINTLARELASRSTQ